MTSSHSEGNTADVCLRQLRALPIALRQRHPLRGGHLDGAVRTASRYSSGVRKATAGHRWLLLPHTDLRPPPNRPPWPVCKIPPTVNLLEDTDGLLRFVACCPLLLLMCAVLMTSSHFEGQPATFGFVSAIVRTNASKPWPPPPPPPPPPTPPYRPGWVPASWSPNWMMNKSVSLYWRNSTGIEPAEFYDGMGMAVFDWAHGSEQWATPEDGGQVHFQTSNMIF